MHWSLVVLALALLGFAAISGRIDGTSFTPAMVFTAVGLVVGAKALGLDVAPPYGPEIKLLAEATLSVVLFSEASRIDRDALFGELGLPARLLGIGLPLTIVAGFAAALGLFGTLAWAEALLLAVILAPTDAALGQALVSLPRLPLRVRQSLNVESGLNDGLCVPIFLIVLAVAQAEEAEVGWGHAMRVLAEKIGYGALGGVPAGIVASAVVLLAERTRFVKATWLQVVPVAAAALAFGFAEAIGGSGFIAAYVGGAVFGRLPRRHEESVSYLIDEVAAVLAAATFVVFGAALLRPSLDDVTWQIAVYAVLSLTLIRMVPVAISLLGTRSFLPTVALFGWFGPRGLASIIFALILVEEGGLPHDGVILTTAFVTVGLSVLAHGVSAAPLASRYADWSEADDPGGPDS
jgi:sodium/hydrogen antiporter